MDDRTAIDIALLNGAFIVFVELLKLYPQKNPQPPSPQFQNNPAILYIRETVNFPENHHPQPSTQQQKQPTIVFGGERDDQQLQAPGEQGQRRNVASHLGR
jgi:hypothetical protein